jgi:hypothetical protein
VAKDPAFLFYPGDWLGGTMTMSRAQKGAYMDLLICQFNEGHMSLETVKIVLGETDFAAMWESKLKVKFKLDGAGNFFNEKLEKEANRRKTYTDSRSKNRSNKNHMKNICDTYDKTYEQSYEEHMSSHMETGNRDRNKDEDRRDKGVRGKREVAEEVLQKATDTATKLIEIQYPWDTEQFMTAWETWKLHRKQTFKLKYNPIGEQAALTQLANLADGDEEIALQILRQTIANGWRGFFPLKNDQKPNAKGYSKEKFDAAIEQVFRPKH